MNKKAIKLGTLLNVLKPFFENNHHMRLLLRIDNTVYDNTAYDSGINVDPDWFWNSFDKEIVVHIYDILFYAESTIIVELSTEIVDKTMEVVSGSTINVYDFVSLFDFQLNEYNACPYIGVVYGRNKELSITDMIVPYFTFDQKVISHPNYKVQQILIAKGREVDGLNISIEDPLYRYVRCNLCNCIIKVFADFIPQGMTHNHLYKNIERITNTWPR